MELYIMYGKWPTYRCGIEVCNERRVLYLPHINLKFSVDDREIRNMSKREENDLAYLMKLLKESKEKSSSRHLMGRINLVKKEIKNDLISKIMESYKLKNREFFFNLNL